MLHVKHQLGNQNIGQYDWTVCLFKLNNAQNNQAGITFPISNSHCVVTERADYHSSNVSRKVPDPKPDNIMKYQWKCTASLNSSRRIASVHLLLFSHTTSRNLGSISGLRQRRYTRLSACRHGLMKSSRVFSLTLRRNKLSVDTIAWLYSSTVERRPYNTYISGYNRPLTESTILISTISQTSVLILLIHIYIIDSPHVG
jgi:hypothetical protein